MLSPVASQTARKPETFTNFQNCNLSPTLQWQKFLIFWYVISFLNFSPFWFLPLCQLPILKFLFWGNTQQRSGDSVVQVLALPSPVSWRSLAQFKTKPSSSADFSNRTFISDFLWDASWQISSQTFKCVLCFSINLENSRSHFSCSTRSVRSIEFVGQWGGFEAHLDLPRNQPHSVQGPNKAATL